MNNITLPVAAQTGILSLCVRDDAMMTTPGALKIMSILMSLSWIKKIFRHARVLLKDALKTYVGGDELRAASHLEDIFFSKRAVTLPTKCGPLLYYS